MYGYRYLNSIHIASFDMPDQFYPDKISPIIQIFSNK